MNDFFKSIYKWFKSQHIVLRVLMMILVFGAIISGLMYLLSLLTVSLWNWLMPEIFGLPTITQWQAIGLILLISIFKGVVSNNSDNNKRTIHIKEKSYPQEKDDFDDQYEKWWNEKGEKSFNQYVEDRD